MIGSYSLAVENEVLPSGQLHVLIVDDDIELTDALSDVLELNDVTVSVANNGEEALALLEAEAFDCVLMDIMMPGMNGVDVMKRARQLSPGSIIMLMTAYSMEELIDEAKREGALAILRKPIEIDSLITFLNQFKDGSSALIVGNDSAVCQLLQQALAPRGYRTYIAKDATEAVAAVSLNHYAVVFVNDDRKDAKGVETVMAIRRLDHKVAFVLLNSHADVRYMLGKGLEPESLIALPKPFSIEAVVTLLERLHYRKLRQALKAQHIAQN
jgi:DNA-binding NtrC family response regulator